jgi:hypothetical protein
MKQYSTFDIRGSCIIERPTKYKTTNRPQLGHAQVDTLNPKSKTK